MIKTQKIKINPTESQKRKLSKLFSYRRFCYNRDVEWWYKTLDLVKERKAQGLDATHWYPNNYKIRDICKQHRLKWESQFSGQVLDTVSEDVERAYQLVQLRNKKIFGKKRKNGQFEKLSRVHFISKKKSKDTVRFYRKNEASFKLDGKFLALPKFNKTITEIKGKRKIIKIKKEVRDWLKLCEEPKFTQDQIRTITVNHDGYGNYFISVSYETEQTRNFGTIPKRTVGIDLGEKTFATLAYDSENQRTYEEIKGISKQVRLFETQIDKINKMISIKELNPTRNHSKRVQKLMKTRYNLHQKSNNLKSDFLHKITTMLVRRFGTICIEDLKPQNLIKNHHQARDLSRQSWGRFKELLVQKCEMHKRNLVIADQWFPSTQKCSCCGYTRNKVDRNKMTLKDRFFICPKCGYNLKKESHSRDKNAAYNLKLYAEHLAEGGHTLWFDGCSL